MKVKDIMQEHIEYVSEKDTIRKVAHLIFSKRINGVPVVKYKKAVGFISERDILSAFLPSMGDVIDDPVRSRNFLLMEERSEEILRMPVTKIMSKEPTLIKDSDAIMKAESVMIANKVGRLPVVDSNSKLVGIITKGDIFKALIGDKIPYGKEESFFDWFSIYNDIMIDWKRRLSLEIPELSQVFKENNVKKIVDVASGTGEHVISLAKEGYEVYGIEVSRLIYDIAQEKLSSNPSKVQKKATFLNGRYKSNAKKLPDNIDAAIFMGNALPFIAHTENNILEMISKKLKKKGSVLILQLENLHKIMNRRAGTTGFVKVKSSSDPKKEHGFLGFYNEVDDDNLLYNRIVFSANGDRWDFDSMSSTYVSYIEPKNLISSLEILGFSTIKLYGGPLRRGGLFREAFEEEHSDSLNIVAIRD